MIEFKKWVREIPNNNGDNIIPFNIIKTEPKYILDATNSHDEVILSINDKPAYVIMSYDEKEHSLK